MKPPKKAPAAPAAPEFVPAITFSILQDRDGKIVLTSNVPLTPGAMLNLLLQTTAEVWRTVATGPLGKAL